MGWSSHAGHRPATRSIEEEIAPGMLQTAHNTIHQDIAKLQDKDMLLTLSSSCIFDKSGDTSVSQALFLFFMLD